MVRLDDRGRCSRTCVQQRSHPARRGCHARCRCSRGAEKRERPFGVGDCASSHHSRSQARPTRAQIREARSALASMLNDQPEGLGANHAVAPATARTRTGDHNACSDTASAEKADAWAVPTIAFETGELVRACGSSDNQAATARHDVQVSAYLPVCVATCARSSAAHQRYVV